MIIGMEDWDTHMMKNGQADKNLLINKTIFFSKGSLQTCCQKNVEVRKHFEDLQPHFNGRYLRFHHDNGFHVCWRWRGRQLEGQRKYLQLISFVSALISAGISSFCGGRDVFILKVWRSSN